MGNASRCAIKLSRHQLLRDPENFLTFFLSSSPFRQPFPATFRLPQLHSGKILVMSDAEGESQKPFCVEYANSGRAGCKKCKQKIDKGAMRIGKLAPNPFSEGLMKQWFHPQCIFEAFLKQRATTARIRDLNEDVDGVDALKSEDRDSLNELIDRSPGGRGAPVPKKSPEKTPTRKVVNKDASNQPNPVPAQPLESSSRGGSSESHARRPKDDECDSFREFRKICAKVAAEPSYTGKTALIKSQFNEGVKGKGFQGDKCLWVKMLLPGVEKRIYNLKRRQLTKLFANMFECDFDAMLEEVETTGDVAQSIGNYFERSKRVLPSKKSELTLREVDKALDELAKVTKEDDQTFVLKNVAKRCTVNDLVIFIRLIVHDLRITAGPKHILEAIHSDAYATFQASRNLDEVVRKFSGSNKVKTEILNGSPVKINPAASLMTPVIPMLAEASKSVDHAFKRCPNGMFAEIKYDGERVQVHKHGNDFKYFSRSLKPVLPHKVSHLKDFIPKAFPTGDDMILDSEILLVDTNTGKLLPFGTLGKHKKAAFEDATVCIFVFDCIHFNGENLMKKPLDERKRILQTHMTEIKNHVMFSEVKLIKAKEELQGMISRVIKEGLEGLVLKDPKGMYEPGKRHWMKMKKDYLAEGAMADTADLVVLGAWYGTGNKGGLMSVWLMGCHDEDLDVWKTVTKVHGGLDDKTLAKFQDHFKPLMTKIGKDASKVPNWLQVSRTMVPDFIVKDPKKSPVWEITGAEFTQHEVHTADGISIRFPRITRLRDDKDFSAATNLNELRLLYTNSKTSEEPCEMDIDPPIVSFADAGEEISSLVTARKRKSDSAGSPSSPKKNKNGTDSEEIFSPASSSKMSIATSSGEEISSMVTARKRKSDSAESPSSPKKKKNGTESEEIFSPASSSKLSISTSSGEEISSMVTPRKRKSDSGESPSSPKKKKNGTKSEEIFSPASSSKLSISTSSGKNGDEYPSWRLPRDVLEKRGLHNVFSGMSFHVPEDIPDRNKLVRYIVAYDGELLEGKDSASRATHILSRKKINANGMGKVVPVTWAWDCIKTRKLLPEGGYPKK